MFLTADHGAAEVPAYLSDINVPGSNIGKDNFSILFDEVYVKYGVPDLIKNISNNQIFLNQDRILSLQLSLEDVQKFVVNKIIKYPFVSNAYTATTMLSTHFKNGLPMLLQNGYNQKLSGDVLFSLQPGVIVYGPKGTTHGSGYSYDTHVPLLFYGNGIKNGVSYESTNVTDIAPTISALLGISFPSGANGTVIERVIY